MLIANGYNVPGLNIGIDQSCLAGGSSSGIIIPGSGAPCPPPILRGGIVFGA